MFINFFKSSFFSQYLVIFITGLLLWMAAFIDPVAMPAPDGEVPLYRLVFETLQNYPFIATSLGFLLVLGETYFLGTIFSRHELVLKNSSVSSLIFIVMISFFPTYLTLTPINISLAFLIIIFYQILIFYNKPEHLDRVFVAGFTTSIASFFYLPFVIWFAYIIVSLLVCRAGNWRAWMAAFIGLITPFIYLAVWSFWNDEFMAVFERYLQFFTQIANFYKPISINFYILLIFTILLSVWGLLFHQRGTDNVVEIRAKSNVLLWTITFTVISVVYARSMILYHVVLAIPAFTMVITRSLTGLRKIRLAEIILLVYFFMILLNNSFIYRYFNP